MANLTAQRMNSTWSRITQPLSSSLRGSYSSFVRPTTSTNTTSQILDQLQAQQVRTNLANKKREKEIRNLLSGVIEQYQPGGSFGAGVEADLARQKEKTVAEGTQAAISGGMANVVGGTQAIGSLGRAFEEEIGAPTRLKLEDLRMERLAQAKQGLAGFVERIQNTGPNYDLIAQILNRG